MQLTDRALTVSTGIALAIAGGAASVFLGDNHDAPDPVKVAFLDPSALAAPLASDAAAPVIPGQALTKLNPAPAAADPLIFAALTVPSEPSAKEVLSGVRTVKLPSAIVDLSEIHDIELTRSVLEIDAPSALRVAAVEPALGSGRTTPTLPRVQIANCELDIRATPTNGALISLTIGAPCHPASTAQIEHAGISFSQILDENGHAKITVPAFEEYATFDITLNDGVRGTVGAYVPDMSDVSRVAVSYGPDQPADLHAIASGAAPDSPDHMWRGAPSSKARALTFGGGYVVSLGTGQKQAQVFTLPNTRTNAGARVSVQLQTKVKNCDKAFAVQIVAVRNGVLTQNKSISLMDDVCKEGASFVLKNVVKDLTVASR
ncbi:MAG: hypothetical protein AAF393_17795 [Pseudomonadota bacterium]